jgi:hypothetical protein
MVACTGPIVRLPRRSDCMMGHVVIVNAPMSAAAQSGVVL